MAALAEDLYPPRMLVAATICFVLHTLVALVDGAHFHLYKYKLYTRPESIVEHFTHTLQRQPRRQAHVAQQGLEARCLRRLVAHR